MICILIQECPTTINYLLRKSQKGGHLLDPKWNGLFLILSERLSFTPLGNRTRVPLIAIWTNWLPCELNWQISQDCYYRTNWLPCELNWPISPDFYYWHWGSISEGVKNNHSDIIKNNPFHLGSNRWHPLVVFLENLNLIICIGNLDSLILSTRLTL